MSEYYRLKVAERSWRFWTLLRRAVITITSAQMRKDIKDDCLWNLMQREILYETR